jgi:hypothetical protein
MAVIFTIWLADRDERTSVRVKSRHRDLGPPPTREIRELTFERSVLDIQTPVPAIVGQQRPQDYAPRIVARQRAILDQVRRHGRDLANTGPGVRNGASRGVASP